MKKELSIVIPCYNEEKSLPEIILKAKFITDNFPIEIIILNNGSKDQTFNILKNVKKNEKLKIKNINQNRGYGYGIKYGLKYCNSDFVGWTHADLQTDIFDCIRVLNAIQSKNKLPNLFFKGFRYGRSKSDSFISKVMELFVNTLFLTSKFKEINAQPSVYPKSIKKDLIKNGPDNYLFDFYAYFKAIKAKLKPVRIKVLFLKRGFGLSHWNKDFSSKIKFIKLNIIYIFKFRLKNF